MVAKYVHLFVVICGVVLASIGWYFSTDPRTQTVTNREGFGHIIILLAVVMVGVF
jgi:hypothetical protein